MKQINPDLWEKYKDKISPAWFRFLRPLLESQELKDVYTVLREAKVIKKKIILPTQDKVWRVFQVTPRDKLKVVILGQDPYHSLIKGIPAATGLAFESGAPGYVPPSLRNILKEMDTDLYSDVFNLTDFPLGKTGKVRLDEPLEALWGLPQAEQGVLLLNTALTVEKGNAGAHTDAWKPFIKKLIFKLSNEHPDLVWVLWGKKAQEFESLIKNGSFVTSPHPSPFSAHKGFFGSQPFSTINNILENKEKETIIW